MANITMEVKEIVDKKTLLGYTLVITGSFQVDAQPEVMRKIDELRNQSKLRDFLIDMRQVNFLDNRGVNALTTIQDNLDKESGRLAYFGLAEKHLNFMKVLGLGKNLKLYEDEEKALFAFYNKVPRKTIPKNFPFNIDCQECAVEIIIPKFGAYKCPRCNEGFTVDKDGEVSYLGKAGSPVIQLTTPYGKEFIGGVTELARGTALRSGFDETAAKDISAAFRTVCELINSRRKSPESDGGHFQILIVAEKNKLTLRTSDYSQEINPEGPDFAAVRKVFKTCQRKAHPKGGNLLLLATSTES